jgi:hypothetical protein
VMDYIIAAGKVALVLFEQIDTFVPPTLHLHNMRDGVDTPEVGRVDIQGRPSGWLRRGLIATLSVGEAATR